MYRKVKKMHARMLQEDQLFPGEDGEGGENGGTRFAKGDYLMIGSRGNRYPMTRGDFMARYDIIAPGIAESEELGAEGFQQYTPTGKVWAHELTADEITSHFPEGTFEGRWGGNKKVVATDVFVMPYPDGGEVYSIRKDLFDQSYDFNRWSVFNHHDEKALSDSPGLPVRPSGRRMSRNKDDFLAVDSLHQPALSPSSPSGRSSSFCVVS